MGWQDAPIVQGGWQSAPVVGQSPEIAESNRFRGFALGALKPVDNAAVALQTGVNNLLGTDFQSASQAASENDAARLANPNKGMQVVGNIAGTAPTLALPVGPLMQGAAGGALLSEADTPLGVGLDALGGALFSKGGDMLVRGAQATIAPAMTGGIKKLRDAGINLSPGQALRASGSKLGEALAVVEDKMTSLPFVGDMIEAGRRQSLDQFNRAAVNRALVPIGGKLPKDIPLGHDAIKFAGDALSDGFNRVLAGVRGQIDRRFVPAIAAIKQSARLPAAYAQQFDEIVQREVLDMFPNGRVDGRALGKVKDRLDKIAAAYGRNADDPYLRDLGEALGNVRQALLAQAGRIQPNARPLLKALDQGWAELVRVERAALNTVEGLFTPNQYKQAINIADRSVRKRSVSRGTALAQRDLAKPAQQALPSKYPDSGTAGRAAQANLFALGLGGALALPYAGARGATQFVTRTPGPLAQKAAAGLTPLRKIAPLVGPSLLLRPQE